MPKRIYVGNLPFNATESDVKGYFRGNAHFVEHVKLRADPASKSACAAIALGDGMPNAAVDKLNGLEVDGHKLVAGTSKEILVNHEEQWWE